MTTHLFTNNATGSLTADITAIDVSFSLGVGEGVLFPNPVSGESFRVTIYSGSLSEIVEVTARTGDVFTIVRSKENTTARHWSAGSSVQLRLTAEQLEDIQRGSPANAALGALAPAADRVPYFTGASAAALTTLTAFARTLLAATSAAAARAVLGAASLTSAEALTNKAISNSTLDNSPVGATTPSTGAFTTLAATALTCTSLAVTGGGAVIPPRGIILWSGTIADIPAGWALCNGANGTPDLRNMFVIGAYSDDAGAAKTTVTGAPTLTGGSKDAIVVAHEHDVTVVDPGHRHKAGSTTGEQGGYNVLQTRSAAEGTLDTSLNTTGITIDVAPAGLAGTNANLPPYYALAYIMKTA